MFPQRLYIGYILSLVPMHMRAHTFKSK